MDFVGGYMAFMGCTAKSRRIPENQVGAEYKDAISEAGNWLA